MHLKALGGLSRNPGLPKASKSIYPAEEEEKEEGKTSGGPRGALKRSLRL